MKNATAQNPYFWNFDDSTELPEGWSVFSTNDNYKPFIYDDESYSPLHCLRFRDYESESFAVMPMTEIANIASLTVKLYYYTPQTYYSLDIGVMTDPTNTLTFVKISTITPTNSSNWIQYSLPLSSYTGAGKYIAFRSGNLSYFNYFHIDDVRIESSCGIPENVSAQTIETGVLLTWNAVPDAQSYNIYKNDDQFSTLSSTTNEATITNLESGENCFRVNAVCVEGEGLLSESVCITNCETITTLPFHEGFEQIDVPNLSDCWTQYSFDSDGDDVDDYWVSSSEKYHTGSQSAFVNWDRPNNDDWLITPKMILPSNKVSFSFWVKTKSDATYDESFNVLVSNSGKERDNFVALGDTITILNTQWDSMVFYPHEYASSISLTAGDEVFFAIQCVSKNKWGLYIDDISVAEVPCLRPTNLQVSDITSNTANISWTIGDAETSWNVIISPTEISDWSSAPNPTTVTSPQYSAEDLAVNTTYYYYIQAVCDETNVSSWNSGHFSTDCPKAAIPYDCDFENETENLCWKLENGTQTNRWCIGTAGGNGYTGKGLFISDDGFYNNYSISSESYVYAYRTIADMSGSMRVSFNWRANGEYDWDFLRVFLVPDSVLLIAGEDNGIGSNSTPTGWISLTNGKLNLQNDWQIVDTIINIEHPGNYNLVFYWKNDNTIGNQKPAAIDNIMVKEVVLPNCEITTLPYHEGFEQITVPNLPDCWTQYNFEGDDYWKSSDVESHTGSQSAFVNWDVPNNDDWLITPKMILQSNKVSFSFWVKTRDDDTYDESFNVLVSNSGKEKENFVALGDTITIMNTQWDSMVFFLNEYASSISLTAGEEVYFAIQCVSKNKWGLYIDDISVAEVPCSRPTNLQVSDITFYTANISWTTGDAETSWNVIISPTEISDLSSAPNPTTVTSPQYSAEDLAVNTTYYYYIQSVCEETNEYSWNSGHFSTDCPKAAIPYDCDFENETENQYWKFENGTQTNRWCIGTAGGNGNTGKGLFISDDGFYNNYSNTSSYVYAYRTIADMSGSMRVRFNWRANGESNYDFLRVFLVPDSVLLIAGEANGMKFGSDPTPTGWISLTNGKLNLQNDWQIVDTIINFEHSGNYNLVFYWKNDSGGGAQKPAAIDNISVERTDSMTLYVSDSIICHGNEVTLSVFNVIEENFNGLRGGDETSTSAYSNNITTGNFITNKEIFRAANEKIYEAGNSIKIGSGSDIGKITSIPLNLSEPFQVFIRRKGWKNEHGELIIKVGNQEQIVPALGFLNWPGSYSDTLIFFNAATDGDSMVIQTSNDDGKKRAFIDHLSIYTVPNAGYSYLWSNGATTSGITVSPETTTTYWVTITNDEGFEATFSKTIIVNDNFKDTFAVACNSFTWYGTEYTTTPAIAPTHTFTNAAGCDSIVTLHLTINVSDTTEFSATACNTYTWNNEIFIESGDYEQTLHNQNECDSVVTLHLTINYSETYEFSATACDSYTWNNTNYTESGDYVQTFQNALGCDSVVTLHLTINESETYEFAATACNEYTWNNEIYTESGDYVQTFQNALGCDSVVTLNLTINESETYEFSAIACDQYTWNNEIYTASGDYVQTFQNTLSCDSVVTLHLTINESETYEFSATACDSYT
ncbi:MAG: choice-of-anchor J domain-containing protein, partial [Bacteroidales bacterium]|nr:choice-of-anchor J domain-containing protein [Bacteroidales bacterium]